MYKRLARPWFWTPLVVVLVLVLLAILNGQVGSAHTPQGLGSLLAILIAPQFVAAALLSMTPLLLAALGGLINELSGVLNLALEAMMLCGALASYIGALASN